MRLRMRKGKSVTSDTITDKTVAEGLLLKTQAIAKMAEQALDEEENDLLADIFNIAASAASDAAQLVDLCGLIQKRTRQRSAFCIVDLRD